MPNSLLLNLIGTKIAKIGHIFSDSALKMCFHSKMQIEKIENVAYNLGWLLYIPSKFILVYTKTIRRIEANVETMSHQGFCYCSSVAWPVLSPVSWNKCYIHLSITWLASLCNLDHQTILPSNLSNSNFLHKSTWTETAKKSPSDNYQDQFNGWLWRNVWPMCADASKHQWRIIT